MRPWGSSFFDHVGRHVEAFQGLPPHIHRAVVEAYIQGALVSNIPAQDFDALTAPWLSREGASSFYRQFAQADETYTAEIEPQFGSIRCPVKIVWGEDDPWIPLERGRALHQRMPNAEFAIISGAGHMPQIEKAKEVVQHIQDFVL